MGPTNSKDKLIVALDSQKLNMVQNCGYKYNLTFNRDLIPVHKVDFFEKGDLMHKMLEVYYTMHMDATSRPCSPDEWSMNKAIEICEKAGEQHAIGLDLGIEDVDENFRVFREYVEHYWGERIITKFVEQVGSKVLYEDSELVIIYDTKIDWGVEISNYSLMPADHKTSGRRGDTVAISNQFMGYCWMMNVNNLMVNKIGFQKTVKPSEKFSRPIMSYPIGVIDNWRINAIYWVKEILRYEQINFWPQNFTSCDKYSGCIFRPVCEGAPESRDHKIAQLFEISEQPWDVGRGL